MQWVFLAVRRKSTWISASPRRPGTSARSTRCDRAERVDWEQQFKILNSRFRKYLDAIAYPVIRSGIRNLGCGIPMPAIGKPLIRPPGPPSEGDARAHRAVTPTGAPGPHFRFSSPAP